MSDKTGRDDKTPRRVGERIVEVIQSGDASELNALKEGLDRLIAEAEAREAADIECEDNTESS